MGLTKKDILDLEKKQLMEDAKFLSKIINFNEEGAMSIKIEQNDMQQYYKLLKGNEYLENTDQVEDEEKSYECLSDDKKSNSSANLIQYKFHSTKNE